jgi:hypothetical protein
LLDFWIGWASVVAQSVWAASSRTVSVRVQPRGWRRWQRHLQTASTHIQIIGSYPDQQFAVFGWYSGRYYNAIESYRIVPIGRDFYFGVLNGKTFAEQMQIILSNRVSNLNDEISQDEKDKASLEKYLKGQSR